MKRNEAVINYGAIEIGEIEFAEDIIQVWINVESVSDSLKEFIDKAIEVSKEEALENLYRVHGKSWGSKGVTVFGMTLNVIAHKDKELETELYVNYEDLEDDNMWGGACIKVDLSGYEDELKQLVIKSIVNRFF